MDLRRTLDSAARSPGYSVSCAAQDTLQRGERAAECCAVGCSLHLQNLDRSVATSINSKLDSDHNELRTGLWVMYVYLAVANLARLQFIRLRIRRTSQKSIIPTRL